MAPSLEDAREPSVTGAWLPWLQLVVTALAVGALLFAVISVARSGGDWLLSMVVAAVGALVTGGVVWSRSSGTISQHPRTAEAGWAALHAELARGRRHHRPFVLLGIPDEIWSPVDADRSERAEAGTGAALSLHSLLRTPDRAWADGSVLYVLLTDCDAAQAEAFLQRARTSMPQLFPLERVKIATFPDDGITLGAVLDKVHLQTGERPTDLVA